MSTLKKLASQTLTYGVPNILGRFINVLLLPIYTFYLSSIAEYGIVTIIYTLIAFLSVLYTHGMETAFFSATRKAQNISAPFSNAFWSVLGVGSILTIAGIVVSPQLAHLNHYAEQSHLFVLMFLILFLDALSSIPFALLRKQNKAKKYVMIRSAGILINVLFNLLFIPVASLAYKHGLININPSEHFVSLIFIANLIASSCVFIFLGPTLFPLLTKPSANIWKPMLRYAWPLIIVGFAGIVNETLDRLMLKHMLPQAIADTQVGIYSAFYKISLVITLFIQSFRYAAEPFFFNHADQNNPQQMYAKVLDYFVWICGFILLLTLLFTPWIASILIRDKSYFNDPIGLQIVPILLLANLFLGMVYNLSIWYKLSNQTLLGSIVSILGACITIVLNIIFIPHYGIMGAAYATLGAYFGMTLISFLMGKYYYPVPYSYIKLSLIILILSSLVLLQTSQGYHMGTLISASLCYAFLFWWYEKPHRWIQQIRNKRVQKSN